MKTLNLKGLDEQIFYDKCDNGLEIYLWVNKKVKNFYATLNIKYGSVDTEFAFKNKKTIHKVPKGIAHFLEHLKFNQPNGISAHEYYSKLGSNINAFTSYDYTAYEVIAGNNFKENINYLLDYVQTPYFTKEAVNKEKGIIIEEIKMYDDNPGFKLFSTTNECLYNKDNHKYLVSGTIEDVRKTTVEDINLVYDTFYHPENMFMVITGNFNPEEALALIEENQSKKTFIPYKNPHKIKEKESVKVFNTYKEIYHNVEVPKIKIAFKMKRSNFESISDLDLRLYLNGIMKSLFGQTSILKEHLLKNNLISGELVIGVIVKDNYVILSVIAETNYPKEIIKTIRETMNNINIDEKEIKRKNKAGISNTVLTYDDIEAVNSDLQEDIITYNEVITDIIPKLKSLNLNDTKKVISSIKTNNSTVIVLYPKGK